MKSKTKIEKQMQKKNNPELVKTIISAKKHPEWLKIAEILSMPRRKRTNINLEEINNQVKQGEKIIIPGKVLSQGDIDKKIKVIALNFSDKAKEKLLNAKCEISTIPEEIKKNPQAKDIRVLKNIKK